MNCTPEVFVVPRFHLSLHKQEEEAENLYQIWNLASSSSVGELCGWVFGVPSPPQCMFVWMRMIWCFHKLKWWVQRIIVVEVARTRRLLNLKNLWPRFGSIVCGWISSKERITTTTTSYKEMKIFWDSLREEGWKTDRQTAAKGWKDRDRAKRGCLGVIKMNRWSIWLVHGQQGLPQPHHWIVVVPFEITALQLLCVYIF